MICMDYNIILEWPAKKYLNGSQFISTMMTALGTVTAITSLGVHARVTYL